MVSCTDSLLLFSDSEGNFMGQLESAQRGPGSWSNMQLACLRGFFQEEIALNQGSVWVVPAHASRA